MPTNDERREVAARLRSVNGAPEWATTACCIAECLGEHDYPLWNDSKPLFNRLADLIEPEPERTCRMTKKGLCSECGEYIVRSYTEAYGLDGQPLKLNLRSWNYCHNCGAKVVSECE